MLSLKRTWILVVMLSCAFLAQSAQVFDPSKDSTQILKAMKTSSVLEVSSAIEVFVSFGELPSYRFVASESIIPLLRVKNDGEVTSFYLEDSDVSRYVRDMKLYVTVPVLSQLKLMGATKANIIGKPILKEIFTLDVSGSSIVVGEQITASKVRIYLTGSSSVSIPVTAEDLKVDVSGASTYTSQVDAKSLALYLSGASSMKVNGKGGDAKIYVSGASAFNANEFKINNAILDVSGASSAKLQVVESIKYDVSGMSRLNYVGTPKILGAGVSGMSSVKSK